MPRRRFGHFDLIDFVAVRLRYAISGEATLATFYCFYVNAQLLVSAERGQPSGRERAGVIGRRSLQRQRHQRRGVLDQHAVGADHLEGGGDTDRGGHVDLGIVQEERPGDVKEKEPIEERHGGGL